MRAWSCSIRTCELEDPTMTGSVTSFASGLMRGKRGLIMGVANDHSIAWGIAKALAAEGAELAFTYQGEALGRRVKPLALSLGADLVVPCDVEKLDTVDAAIDAVGAKFGTIDFLVHGIAYSDRAELKGRYADTTRENFVRTMIISAFSLHRNRQARGHAADGGREVP